VSTRKEEVVEALRAELSAVEGEYKVCAERCYRRIDFPADPKDNPLGISTPLLNLLRAGQLAESVSSWTTSPAVAMGHLDGAQRGDICVIFTCQPRPEQVLLNLKTILRSPRFTACSSAIESWMRSENEVILEIPFVTPDDVYAWGGFVGSLEQLRLEAELLGSPAEAVENLETALAERGIRPGQEHWLSQERSLATAHRMQQLARRRYMHPSQVY